MTIATIFLYLFAYLLGSVQFATIFARMRGIELRQSGTGNPGASNVLASTKDVKLSAVVFLLDTLKGATPVLVAKLLAATAFPEMAMNVQAWCAFFAMLGHAFPIFFGFRGGRGILTAMGGLLALNVWTGLFMLVVVFVIFTPIFKNQPLGVFICIALIPFYPLVFQYPDQSFWMYAACVAIGILALSKRLIFIKRRPISEHTPLGEVFWNRLLFDRDIKDRDAWVAVTKNQPQEK